MILINSANYSAWDLRWRCLQALPEASMAAEAGFLERMLDLNPKNYQLWNYRRRFAWHRGAPHAGVVCLQHQPSTSRDVLSSPNCNSVMGCSG